MVDKADVADVVGVTVGGALSDLYDTTRQLFNDRPGFIASEDDVNPLAKAVRDVSQYNCRVWARSDMSQNSARVNAGNAELCGQYLDGLDESPSPAERSVPFEGGQCEGVAYIVRRQFTTASGSGNQTGFTTELTGIVGPVTSLSPTTFVDPADGQIRRATLTATGANGTRSTELVFGSTSGDPATYRYWLVRQDGQPDNCGDPEPQFQPPTRKPSLSALDAPAPISLPGIGELPFDIEVDPTTGQPSVTFPDLGLEIPLQIGGGEGSDGGATGTPLPPPVESGSPQDIDPEDESGELGEPTPPTEPGFEYRCIGYDWECDDFPSRVGKILGTDTVFPFVWSNLQLKFSVGNEVIRGDNLRLYSTKGSIITPDDSLTVVGLYWQKTPSFSLRLTPIFKKFTEEV